MGVLRDYLAYAREHISPTLSEEAQQRLIQAYVDMRKVGSGRGQISAYPRQLESLIRLSEAHAKVRLSQQVTVVDVEEAFRLTLNINMSEKFPVNLCIIALLMQVTSRSFKTICY